MNTTNTKIAPEAAPFTVAQFFKILTLMVFTPGIDGHMGIPVLFNGMPGIGKTSIIKKVLKHWDFYAKVLIASIHDQTDFSGPLQIKDGFSCHAPPVWCRHTLTEDGEPRPSGIILDELTTNDQRMQAAMLGICFDREVGDFALHEEVRVIAACNPPKVAAGGRPLTAPLANRFCHVNIHVDKRAVSQYIKTASSNLHLLPDPAVVKAAFDKNWDKYLAKAGALVGTFIERMDEDYCLNVPKANSPEASGPWTSPRTMEMAKHVLAAGWVLGYDQNEEDDDLLWQLIAGCVGTATQEELHTFVDIKDIPDPLDVLAGRAQWKADSGRPDLQHVVAALCTETAVQYFHKHIRGDRASKKKALTMLTQFAKFLAESGLETDIVYLCTVEADQQGMLKHSEAVKITNEHLSAMWSIVDDMFNAVEGAA